MRPEDFEALRALTGKRIDDPTIELAPTSRNRNYFEAKVDIGNAGGTKLVMTLRVNISTWSKTINVAAPDDGGAICRLDIDGTAHKPVGRSHKHEVRTPRDVGRDLPNAIAMTHLSGQPMRVCFAEFCRLANIQFAGRLKSPDDDQ